MGVDQPEWRLERALLKELRKDPACLAVRTQLHMPSKRRPDLVAVMATPDGGACLLVVEVKYPRADTRALEQLVGYLVELRAGLDQLGVSLPIASALAAPRFSPALVGAHSNWVDPPVRLITLPQERR